MHTAHRYERTEPPSGFPAVGPRAIALVDPRVLDAREHAARDGNAMPMLAAVAGYIAALPFVVLAASLILT